jgi:hypothetical protein
MKYWMSLKIAMSGEIAVVGSSGTVEKSIRNCETIVISYPHVIQKNSEVRHKLDNAIFDGASKCIQRI